MADLYSAKVLAWLGGAVMLLGIFFFFVLAVNRGWDRPGRARLARSARLGDRLLRRALPAPPVRACVLGLRRGRRGHRRRVRDACSRRGSTTTSSPTGRRCFIAAAIAGVALAAAVAWPSELVAGFGLVGATVAPAAVGLQNGELSAAGTTFAAVMFAVTAVVAVRLNWQRLLIAGVAASLPQAAVLVAQSHATEWDVVAVAGVFWLLNLASALALQMRRRTADLAAFPASLVLLSASFAGASSVVLFDRQRRRLGAPGDRRGLRRGWRPRSSPGLVTAISARCSRRPRSRSSPSERPTSSPVPRSRSPGRPRQPCSRGSRAASRSSATSSHRSPTSPPLSSKRSPSTRPRGSSTRQAQHPASGALALVGAALAGGIVAYYCRPWKAARTVGRDPRASRAVALALFRNSQPVWRSLTGWTAAAVALYAASLGVLGLAQWQQLSRRSSRAFEWGQVAVAGLWGAVALAVLYAGLRRSWNEFRAAGFVVLCVALAQALLFFSTSLSGSPQALGFLVVAAALLAGSLLDRLWRADPTAFPAIVVYALSSLGLAVAAFVLLASGAIEGLALLALAGFYCLISALVFRRDRDLATLLWAPALGVACVGFGDGAQRDLARARLGGNSGRSGRDRRPDDRAPAPDRVSRISRAGGRARARARLAAQPLLRGDQASGHGSPCRADRRPGGGRRRLPPAGRQAA